MKLFNTLIYLSTLRYINSTEHRSYLIAGSASWLQCLSVMSSAVDAARAAVKVDEVYEELRADAADEASGVPAATGPRPGGSDRQRPRLLVEPLTTLKYYKRIKPCIQSRRFHILNFGNISSSRRKESNETT